MKYLSTSITCIEISGDGFNVRVKFAFKNDNRIAVSLIKRQVIPFCNRRRQKEIEILRSSRVFSLDVLCIMQIVPSYIVDSRGNKLRKIFWREIVKYVIKKLKFCFMHLASMGSQLISSKSACKDTSLVAPVTILAASVCILSILNPQGFSHSLCSCLR